MRWANICCSRTRLSARPAVASARSTHTTSVRLGRDTPRRTAVLRRDHVLDALVVALARTRRTRSWKAGWPGLVTRRPGGHPVRVDRLRTSILHNLRGLTTFSGRDDRATFWPWAGLVVVATTVLGNVVGVVGMVVLVVRGLDPGGAGGRIVVALGLASVALHVVLLGASVVRRLRDRGAGIAWAVVPVVAVVVALTAQASVMLPALDGREPDLGRFFLAFALSGLYLLAVAALVVQLALPGRGAEQAPPGAGRPPPAQKR